MNLTEAALVLLVVAFTIFSSGVVVANPDLLQDFSVADYASTVKINGFPCKATFNTTDFSSTLLAKPGLTYNTLGSLFLALKEKALILNWVNSILISGWLFLCRLLQEGFAFCCSSD